MNEGTNLGLPESFETGSAGIFHLKRFWYKSLTNYVNPQYATKEWQLENALMNILGIGLLPTMDFLHHQSPDFETFENWIAAHHGGNIPGNMVTQCNALITGIQTNKLIAEEQDDVLTPEDLIFWKENGYVIVRNAISSKDCAKSRQAIWDFLEMEEHDPASWYKPGKNLQGIMVNLYRDTTLDKNRASPIIRKAFEQLWGHADLIVTTDKAGFNPPETKHFKFRGTGLHWDVSLKQPIPFGVQGILYLTNTAANQGAFTLIPGFHNKIENWLLTLPAGTNARQVDLKQFEPVAIAANEGDLIIWHHCLPHGSSPNLATLPRIVQYLHYSPPLQELQEEWI